MSARPASATVLEFPTIVTPDASSVGTIDAPDLSRHSAADRRAYQRFNAEALWWLRSCRFKYGKPVSVVDLSAGGALLETPFQLRPGSNHVLEFAGPEGLTLALTEVLRCKISRLSG